MSCRRWDCCPVRQPRPRRGPMNTVAANGSVTPKFWWLNSGCMPDSKEARRSSPAISGAIALKNSALRKTFGRYRAFR